MRTASLIARLLPVMLLASAAAAQEQEKPPHTTISCTGVVQPTKVVEVTTPVAGRVARVGPDPRAATDPAYAGKTIDFNTPVEAGTLLLQVDDRTYRAELEQARARLAVAEAELKAAKAAPGDASAVVIAEARVRERRADVALAELRLSQTVVTSPTKGVVIAAHVREGQLLAPYASPAGTLFLIGDLTRYDVWAAVDETAVPKIRAGQRARFTTLAFPGVTFTARVTQVRLDAIRTGDRTTYTVVLAVDNGGDEASARLRPYMTADVEIDIDSQPASAPASTTAPVQSTATP